MRFPVSVVAAIGLCIVNNIEAARLYRFSGDELWIINASLAAAFIGGGAAHLFGQGRKWPAARSFAFGLGVGLLAALLCYFDAQSGAYPIFALFGLTAILLIAGHMRSGTSENALWLFNARLALAAVLSIVVGCVFGAGTTAIVGSVEYLFELDLHHSIYEHIWTTAVALIGPIYGLSLVPEDLDEELVVDDAVTLIDRGLHVLINHVLVPLAVIYVAILHVYAVKILVTWELPRGQIGSMVTSFGLGTAAVFLIARPWAARGTALLRWFLRTWFWFTLVPAVLLAMAVWSRISAYGVTPERYGLALIFIWLIAAAAYFIARRQGADSRVLLAMLAGLLLAASFGPWGARDVSVSSQMTRLIAILEENGYLEDGRLASNIPPRGTINPDIANSASSIVVFLNRVNALQRLKPVFEGHPENPFTATERTDALYAEVNRRLNLYPDPRRFEGREWIHFAAGAPGVFEPPTGSALSGPHFAEMDTRKTRPDDFSGVFVAFEDDQLAVHHHNAEWRIAAHELLERARDHRAGSNDPLPSLQVDIVGDAGPITLLITKIHGHLGQADAVSASIMVWVVVPAAGSADQP